MFLRAAFHCFFAAVIIAAVVFSGLFDSVITEDGHEHYAEKPWAFLSTVFPSINKFPMPANTLVNFGYAAVAIYWLKAANQRHYKRLLTDHQAYMFYMFGSMSLIYAPVQFLRILTQNHHFAVLDQWYTLPIFSWVTVWSCFIINGWNPPTMVSVVTVSSCSYCFTLLKIPVYEHKSFEVALTIHIICAVLFAHCVYRNYPSSSALKAFFMAVLCCIGFVCLKLLDNYLGNLHPFFQVLSGHFWSKIADFLQIHFVFLFFMCTTETMNEKMKIN